MQQQQQQQQQSILPQELIESESENSSEEYEEESKQLSNSKQQNTNTKEDIQGIDTSQENNQDTMDQMIEMIRIEKYIEQLPGTFKETHNKQQNLLIWKKYNAMLLYLTKMVKNIKEYEERWKRMEKQINLNDDIQNLQSDLNSYEEYSQLLQKNIDNLKQQIQDQEIMYNKALDNFTEKKKVLTQSHQENDEKLREDNALLLKQEEKQDDQKYNSQLINQSTLVLKSKQELMKENSILKSTFIQKTQQYFYLQQLFEKCLNHSQKVLIQSQQVTRNQNGLAGSLLFELGKIEQQKKLQKQEQMKQNFQPYSEVYMRNLVVGTLKSMVSEKKKSKQKNPFDNISIPWETFKNFNHLQIMGLLAIKPIVKNQLIHQFEESKQEICQLLDEYKSFDSANNNSKIQQGASNSTIKISKLENSGNVSKGKSLIKESQQKSQNASKRKK